MTYMVQSTKRYYDDTTGLYHISSTEHAHAIGVLSSKGVNINVAGESQQTTDYPNNLHVAKLIKCDFRANVNGCRGIFNVGVIDSAVSVTGVNDVQDFDLHEGFPIDHGAFNAGKSGTWEYRKVWKPNKYAQSSDKDLFIMIDPQGLLDLLNIWSYSLSMYSIWKLL